MPALQMPGKGSLGDGKLAMATISKLDSTFLAFQMGTNQVISMLDVLVNLKKGILNEKSKKGERTVTS
jgi:hypothetical protein